MSDRIIDSNKRPRGRTPKAEKEKAKKDAHLFLAPDEMPLFKEAAALCGFRAVAEFLRSAVVEAIMKETKLSAPSQVLTASGSPYHLMLTEDQYKMYEVAAVRMGVETVNNLVRSAGRDKARKVIKALRQTSSF